MASLRGALCWVVGRCCCCFASSVFLLQLDGVAGHRAFRSTSRQVASTKYLGQAFCFQSLELSALASQQATTNAVCHSHAEDFVFVHVTGRRLAPTSVFTRTHDAQGSDRHR
uniref:Putative secreted protein n=1 Tax=Anopheles marajoara TaxID=58244 RepID=A0A2M4C7V1_9DIPT